MADLITSRRDLTDEQNLRDARAELDRALAANDVAKLADWARRWGRPAVEAIDGQAAAEWARIQRDWD